MKALIIDDEPLARQEIRTLLAAHPQIEICGEAANPKQAARMIEELEPDVLFLDIAMPGGTGFDLLATLPPPHPQVIFTTAYGEHAIRAFEVNALDYLTKPVHPQRLAAAIDRLRPTITEPPPSPTPESVEPWRDDDRIFLREGEACWFVPVRQIHLLTAEGNYTRLHFGTNRPVLYRTLSTFESRLPTRRFFRANRSQMVNLEFIAGVEPWFSGCIRVRLTTGDEIEFSRRQTQLFREQRGV